MTDYLPPTANKDKPQWTAVYYRHGQRHTDEHNTLSNALHILTYGREEDTLSPDSVITPDGRVIDGDLLNQCMERPDKVDDPELRAALDAKPPYRPTVGDAAWHSVWLHGDWQWLTKNMTTPGREYAADAVARYSAHLDADGSEDDRREPGDLRWWRD